MKTSDIDLKDFDCEYIKKCVAFCQENDIRFLNTIKYKVRRVGGQLGVTCYPIQIQFPVRLYALITADAYRFHEGKRSVTCVHILRQHKETPDMSKGHLWKGLKDRKRISVVLTAELRRDLQKEADKAGVSLSKLISGVISEYYNFS